MKIKTTSVRMSRRLFLFVLLLFSTVFSSIYAQAPAYKYHSVDMKTVFFYNKACVGFYWCVRFKVPPTPNGGYIVQHIKLKRRVTDCKDKLLPGEPKNVEYYEAWPVAPNMDTSSQSFSNPSGVSHNDMYGQNFPANTKGQTSWQGTIIFVENPAPNTSLLDSTWKVDTTHYAGHLQHTTTVPPFWAGALASGKAKKHNAYVKWACCNDSVYAVFDTTEKAPEVVLTTTTDTVIVKEVTDETIDEASGLVLTNQLDWLSYLAMMDPDVFKADAAQRLLQADAIISSGNTLRMYPVPAHNYVIIESQQHSDQPLRISVMNLAGQLVLDEQHKAGTEHKLDISALPAGVFIVTVSSEDGKVQERFKLIKQNH